jgi:hypothetical protein
LAHRVVIAPIHRNARTIRGKLVTPNGPRIDFLAFGSVGRKSEESILCAANLQAPHGEIVTAAAAAASTTATDCAAVNVTATNVTAVNSTTTYSTAVNATAVNATAVNATAARTAAFGRYAID